MSTPTTTVGPTWRLSITTRRVDAKVAHASAAEKNHLHMSRDPPPDTDRRTKVRMRRDRFCRIGDVDYSTPPELEERPVGVRASHREVRTYADGHQVARHRRSYVPADVVLDPTHARLLLRARQAWTCLSAANADIPEVDQAC